MIDDTFIKGNKKTIGKLGIDPTLTKVRTYLTELLKTEHGTIQGQIDTLLKASLSNNAAPEAKAKAKAKAKATATAKATAAEATSTAEAEEPELKFIPLNNFTFPPFEPSTGWEPLETIS